MSYFSDFPHTRNSDADLGWLIREWKRLMGLYEDIQMELSRLQDEFDTIPSVIQTALDKKFAEIEIILQGYTNEFNEMRLDLQQMQKNITDFQKIIYELEVTVSLLQVSSKQYTDAKFHDVMIEVETYLKKFGDRFPPVIDPSDGLTENLQTVLWHMYNKLSWGIEVVSFDSLEIPVEEFDAMNITAYDFDTYGLVIFRYWKCCYMFSPFTGEYVPISDVVIRLAEFHMDGVKVEDFDGADIEVNKFDSANIPAEEFDWTSGWFAKLKI